MREKLKKLFSVLLAVITALSVGVFAFAAEETYPVIVVSGMGSFPLYLTGESSSEQVFPPSTESILSVCGKAVLPLAQTALSSDWNDFADGCFESVYSELFEAISCDKSGNSKNNIQTKLFPKNVSNYPDDILNSEKNDDEIGMIKSIAEKVGAENTYFFNYDWRLDPLVHADELSEYIENVKTETGASKVTLVPASMGGTVVNSYLYKYGSESINKIVYCMVASKGLDLVGELFAKNIEISTDMVLERLFSFEKGDILLQSLLAVLQTGVEQSKVVDKALDKFINNFIEQLSDRAYEEILAKSFATMPGMWAFCPDEYYEADKAVMFGDNANSEFIAKIDEYHYNVQCQAESLMKEAENNGVEIYILAAYGYVGFPVTGKAWEQSDCLIETKMESFGATCALYTETFSSDYQALGTVCSDLSHNHVSTDAIVDASTCAFPEQTWFIKNNKHVGLECGTYGSDLLTSIVTSTSQLTVHSDENYPQFVSQSPITGKATSLTGSELNPSSLDGHSNMLTRLINFILSILEKISISFSNG